MTDPVRRDPTEFLRVLRHMARTTSWQKTMIFASKGRMVGYRMSLEHYNTILYSQSVWGRALEMVRVVRAMQDDKVQGNGATYYYIVNGMANADHGWNYDFKINHQLERIQHWRVALDALGACEYNGFDSTDTMHNSALITCVIPGFNHWQKACGVLHKMRDEDRRMHPNMVKFFHDCLIRNWRPREASQLLRLAAEQNVQGYTDAWEADVYKGRPLDSELEKESSPAERLKQVLRGDQRLLPEQMQREIEKASSESMMAEKAAPTPYSSGLHTSEMNSVFRPRVYRQLSYRWHQIANKYRPKAALKRRQLSPRDSPTGIPGFGRL